MEVRRLRKDEGKVLRALRLSALRESPTAFGGSLEAEESLLNFLGWQKTAQYLKGTRFSWRLDLLGALAAGLFVGALITLIDGADGVRDLRRCVNATLVSVLSYLSVILLLQRYWSGALKRMLPHWLMVSVFGSFLLIAIGEAASMKTTLTLWESYQTRMSLFEFIAQELETARSIFLVCVFLTLPITSLIHYAGAIVRFVERWHNGSDQVVSIVKK